MNRLKNVMDMTKKQQEEFARIKKRQVKIARELYYDKYIIEKIKNAMNIMEIDQAMIQGRHLL